MLHHNNININVTRRHSYNARRPLAAVALSFLLLLATTSTTTTSRWRNGVSALPSGAAGCAGGGAASLGFHLDYGPDSDSGRLGDTGTLVEFNTTLFIQNETMTTTNVTLVPGSRVLDWLVTAGEDLPIRGILLRVQPKGATVPFTLSGDPNLQRATICDTQTGNVEGITHRTRVTKLNASGTMRFDQNGLVNIDLTVVYMNGRVAPGDLSIYAHSGFQIDVQNSTPIVPVPVPVAPPPTASPVEDLCATNTCPDGFLGMPGRLFNRFRGGKCRERCSSFSFLTPSFAGWRCGACF